MQNIIEDQKSHEKMLTEDLDAKTAEVQDLEAELQIYKLIAGMALENTQRTEMYIMNLGKKIDARSSSLVELKTQWYALYRTFLCFGIWFNVYFGTDFPLEILTSFQSTFLWPLSDPGRFYSTCMR